GVRAQRPGVEAAAAALLQRGVLGAESEQLAVQRLNTRVAALTRLPPIQPRSLEGCQGLGVRYLLPLEGGEGLELLSAAFGDQPPQLLVVVGEELEGRGRVPLLPHE